MSNITVVSKFPVAGIALPVETSGAESPDATTKGVVAVCVWPVVGSVAIASTVCDPGSSGVVGV